MKFSGVATVGGLLGAASAYSPPPPSCAPTTVYSTVTVTAPYSPPQTYAPVTYGGSSYIAPPYVKTEGPTVTSVDYGYSKTSVWVYPTGNAPSKDCVVAVYEETTVTVIVINISITIINGQTTTIYSTVTGANPTSTPGSPPPPPPPTTTYLPPPPPTTTYSPPPTTTAGSAATHTVIVGGEGRLIYKDNQVNAAVGDIIQFFFNSTNHTVTQSSLTEPCTPLKGGFDTGFTHFNNASRADFLPPVNFTVSVSTPLWFYCAQKNPKPHCQAGMVLGINPAGKFPEFISRATASSTSIPLQTGTGATSIPTATGTGSYYPYGPKTYPTKRAAGYWAA